MYTLNHSPVRRGTIGVAPLVIPEIIPLTTNTILNQGLFIKLETNQNDSTSDSAPHSERANHYSDCRSYKTSNHALGSSRHAKKYHGDGSDSAPHSERANHYSDHTSFESSNKFEKQFTDLENSVDSKFCKFEEQVSSLEGNVQNPILENQVHSFGNQTRFDFFLVFDFFSR